VRSTSCPTLNLVIAFKFGGPTKSAFGSRYGCIVAEVWIMIWGRATPGRRPLAFIDHVPTLHVSAVPRNTAYICASDCIPELWAVIEHQLALVGQLIAPLEENCEQASNDDDYNVGTMQVSMLLFIIGCVHLHNDRNESWHIFGSVLRAKNKTASNASNTS
jgi:hypothetical protein